jgi:hypothetical protein
MRIYNVDAPTPQGPALRNQQAFLQGLDFHEAAARAVEIRRDEAGAAIQPLCPMIVCYAFAIELYLKSLQKKARGHDLSVLFKSVNSPTRKKIEEIYKDRTGRGHKEAETDIEKMARAFEDWRYVFEGEGQQVHTNLLIAFARSALEAAKDLNPSWVCPRHIEDQIVRLLTSDQGPSMTVKNLGGGTFLHLTDGTGGALNTPEAS